MCSNLTQSQDPRFQALGDLCTELAPFPQPSGLDDAALADLIVGQFCSQSLFQTMRLKANTLGIPVDALLIAEGHMREEAFYQALADQMGVDFIGVDQATCLRLRFADGPRLLHNFYQSHLFVTEDGLALCPRGLGASSLVAVLLQVQNKVNQLGASFNSIRIKLVAPSVVVHHYQTSFQDKILDQACHGLMNSYPKQCAKGGPSAWQWLGLVGLAGILIYQGYYAWEEFWLGLFALCSVFFFLLISLRLAACLVRGKLALDFRQRPPLYEGSDRDLPIYTLLVPLFKEAHMLPQLIEGLGKLDYPKPKLDIKLLLEESDPETIEAANALDLPPHYQVLIVPDAKPRTKPKALNYGLALARGTHVVIYDAEDLPEPDQLKKALALFARHDDTVATLQAKLNFYNPRESWLAKQFTVEYCSLFDGLLPAFRLFDFPLPLGGTSNHFRKAALVEVGAWDAFNVTEDADLGMRLYRHGFRSEVLMSTTYEEAAARFRDWLPQRTRWMKGWMQTYYVHMRQPLLLLRQMGLWRFLGFQAIIGGVIFSHLAHPVFLGLLLWEMPFDTLPSDLSLIVLWVLSLFNLSFGYFVTMWLGVFTIKLRSLMGFSFAILTLPFYWILMSIAAYRALFQLLYAPFLWEKTHHKGLSSQS